MAAAAAKSGGGGGAQKISEVDSDRLWRDRVSQELTYQRKWVEEYGFMLDEAAHSRLKAGSARTAMALTETASDLGTSDGLGNKTLNASKVVGYSPIPAVGPLLSVQRASYKILPSPEIKNDPSPFRRRKHPPR
mmetsp:Transcript_23529/g.27257  ORF Transcript_23529/g.27257 Transcript_23529/m.27257 type:complete len:134 (+) Transcript_23529:32-433(+)